MKTKRVAFLGISVALAMVLSFVENQIAFFLPIYGSYGIKLGLANIVIVFLLYKVGFWEGAAVNAVRVVLVSVLFGNVQTFLFGFTGAVISLVGMGLLKKSNMFSYVAVSVVGGVLHNIGQIAVAVLWTQTKELVFYLPVLLLTGTVAGIAVGLISGFLLKRLKNIDVTK